MVKLCDETEFSLMLFGHLAKSGFIKDCGDITNICNGFISLWQENGYKITRAQPSDQNAQDEARMHLENFNKALGIGIMPEETVRYIKKQIVKIGWHEQPPALPDAPARGGDVAEAIRWAEKLQTAHWGDEVYMKYLNTLIKAAQREIRASPNIHRLNVHIVLDALATAAKGGPLDPETCQTIESIVKEYDHSDFTKKDVQALYDCGPRSSQREVTGEVVAALEETKEFIERLPKGIGRGAASPLYMKVTQALAIISGNEVA